VGCPPDTDEKRLARFYLYRKVRHLWEVGDPLTGCAVVLAGDEASEIGCLRYYLKREPETTYFVDVDKAGLDLATSLWKGVRTFHGSISDAIPQIEDSFAFVNLDFCGFMREEIIQSLAGLAGKIPVYGVVSYTFLRSREGAYTPGWEVAQDLATDIMEKDPRFKKFEKNSPEWLDAVRFLGYTEILRRQLGKTFEPVFRLRYTGGRRSNMGMVALQNVPPFAKTPAWRKEVSTARSFEEKSGVILGDDLALKIRDLALTLTDVFPTKEVAQILHIPRGTMAAYQANKTRGTYRKVEEPEEP
jgi:hypothetical protein